MEQEKSTYFSISIHAPREEGDGGQDRPGMAGKISIHAPREEGDMADPDFAQTGLVFLSTPPARRATLSAISSLLIFMYFYPRPPRGGRLLYLA